VQAGNPPPPPPGGNPNCNSITITPAAGSIDLSGLTAPVVTVQVFNSSWATVYNQTFTNSPGTQSIPSLAAGTYHVKVSFYTASWSPICDKSQTAVVQAFNPGGGAPNCNNISVTPVAGGINLSGLTAPVISVQVFNNSWATVYNQTMTNSPGTLLIPSLSAGVYHVKVNFASASWSPLCEKFVDATVSNGSVANPATVGAVEQNTKQIQTSSVSTITVAPNPFVNAIQVTIQSSRSENASLLIFDATGKELFRKSISLMAGTNRFTLDGSRYKQGSYFLKLVTAKETETTKMVK
jgi:hypothetical protein